MARGVAFDLLQMAKRVGPQYEAAEYEDLSGEESWIASLPMIGGDLHIRIAKLAFHAKESPTWTRDEVFNLVSS